MMDSAPSGSTLASMMSLTISCVSHAVAVAGFTTSGTPASKAGAAFSRKPQLGKLNALINNARPRVGTITCCDTKALSLASETASPSARALCWPSAAPALA
ncbi:Uncharacterised protein [Mycobacteroides abscessus subsp. abscessus]|nr:Uncharacterised protein [Mycobacteroides abscessus subsp. abscessus]